jgi:hypothetical protein
MGVESKLCHLADEATDCCQIETRSVLCFQRENIHTRDRQRRLVARSQRRLYWPAGTTRRVFYAL